MKETDVPEGGSAVLIEQGHLFRWVRGPAAMREDWVELDPTRAKPYFPIESPELMYELGAIRRPADAVSFVSRYGLLRHGPDQDERRERWRDIEHDAATLAAAMRLVSLIRDATDGDAQRSNDAVRDLAKFSARFAAEAGLPRPTSDEETIKQAMQVVVLLVNRGLEGVQSRIAAYSGGYFTFTVDSPTLLAMAYQQLAQAIAGRVPMRECVECGRFFAVKDRRQRFCSKTCGGRARQRRFAEKQRRR